MFLIDAFHEGGFAMYPILLAGVALIIAAARFAARPDPGRLMRVQELRALTLSLGGFGSLLGIVHTLAALRRFGEAERSMALAQGISESINNLGLAFLLSIIAAVITTIATSRSARAEGSQH